MWNFRLSNLFAQQLDTELIEQLIDDNIVGFSLRRKAGGHLKSWWEVHLKG